jgi:voltage-gated potassium channel Kch
MPAFFILIYRFFRSLWHGLKDREFRALFYWVLGIIALGTWFYWRVEGWRALDSLYFTITTLTTVGYGDFAPQTDAGKIFTIFYILVGIGLLSGFVILLAERSGILKRPAEKGKPAEAGKAEPGKE